MFHNLLCRLVLWMMGLRLRWLGNHSDAFRENLRGQEFVLQFRTFDGKAARAFCFNDGHVQPLPGLVAQPSVTLSFLDGRYALGTLLTSTRAQKIMSGLQEQKLKIDGDYAKLMLFLMTLKYLSPGDTE